MSDEKREMAARIEFVKAEGCLCDVQVTKAAGVDGPGWRFSHEPWCPLVRALDGMEPGRGRRVDVPQG